MLQTGGFPRLTSRQLWMWALRSHHLNGDSKPMPYMAPLWSLEAPLMQEKAAAFCSLWLPVPSTAHTLNWASGGPVIITILTLASGASAGAICNRPNSSQLGYFLVSLPNLRPTSLTPAHDWLSWGIKCLLERNYGEAVINMGHPDIAHYWVFQWHLTLM